MSDVVCRQEELITSWLLMVSKTKFDEVEYDLLNEARETIRSDNDAIMINP